MTQHSLIKLLVNIKNGLLAKQTKISGPNTKFNQQVLYFLIDYNYITKVIVPVPQNSSLDIYLNYTGWMTPVAMIRHLKIISKPGCPYYCSASNFVKEFPILKSPTTCAVISTSYGLVTYPQTQKLHCGGELLFYIG